MDVELIFEEYSECGRIYELSSVEETDPEEHCTSGCLEQEGHNSPSSVKVEEDSFECGVQDSV